MAELDTHAEDPTAPLRPETVEAIRAAVARRMVDPSTERALDAALLLLFADARHSQIPAEQLLQTLKAVWEGVPEVRLLSPEQRRQQLAEVASICIARYYQQG